MKVPRLFWTVALAISAVTTGSAQEQTVAHLSRGFRSEGVSASAARTSVAAPGTPSSHAVSTQASELSRTAADALFVHSNLPRAQALATAALRRHPADAEALFVQMEIAAMRADPVTELDSGLKLCENSTPLTGDFRTRLAQLRIRQAAANTPSFRAAVPRIQKLLANSSSPWPQLNEALLLAAMDGVSGLNPYALARGAGILTDWRIVGPLGRAILPQMDDAVLSTNDDLAEAYYGGHAVENFQFPDGTIALPDYLPGRGIYYAASRFGSLVAGRWTVRATTAATLELFIDGARVIKTLATHSADAITATIDLPPGSHHVLAKFGGSGLPLQVQVSPAADAPRHDNPSRLSAQEFAYRLAAAAYVDGDYRSAIKQLSALPNRDQSAPLLFLSAQMRSLVEPYSEDVTRTWERVHSVAPSALGADLALGDIAGRDGDAAEATAYFERVTRKQPGNYAAWEALSRLVDPASERSKQIWAARIATHPSCETLVSAGRFYRDHPDPIGAESSFASLPGCAPESLAYAHALAEDRDHAAAASAYREIVAAAPLNRAARLALVRELQLAGDDAGAQRAAAEWVRIAPNSGNYRRLAAANSGGDTAATATSNVPFYAPYRRNVTDVFQTTESVDAGQRPTILLDDHVAIERPDGSVSLYVHRSTRVASVGDVNGLLGEPTPADAQLLLRRVIHAEGSRQNLGAIADHSQTPGDVLDEEYVVNYPGDGGIAQHSEAFQFVFGSSSAAVLQSRFVVLTPAAESDRGVSS